MFGNIGDMLKKAQNMKSQIDKVKKELENIEVEGSASNGAGIVRMTADMKVVDVSINETLLSSNKELIDNAVKVATNDALAKAKETAAKKLKSVTGGLSDMLPGL